MPSIRSDALLANNYVDSSGNSIGTSNYIYGEFDAPHGWFKGSAILIENNDGSLTFMGWHEDFTGNSGDGAATTCHLQFALICTTNKGTIDASFNNPTKRQLLALQNNYNPFDGYQVYNINYQANILNASTSNNNNSSSCDYGSPFSDLVYVVEKGTVPGQIGNRPGPGPGGSWPIQRYRLYPVGGNGTTIEFSNIIHSTYFVSPSTQNPNFIYDGTLNGQTLTLQHSAVSEPILGSALPPSGYESDTIIFGGSNLDSKYTLKMHNMQTDVIQSVKYTLLNSQTMVAAYPSLPTVSSASQYTLNCYLVNSLGTTVSNTLSITLLTPGAIFGSPSNIASTTFAPPVPQYTYRLKIGGPDAVSIGDVVQYNAIFTTLDSNNNVISAQDVTSQCSWSSLHKNAFFSTDGKYKGKSPAGGDIIIADYDTFTSSDKVYTATKNITVKYDATLLLTAEKNPINTSEETRLKVYYTPPITADAINPILNRKDVTALVTVQSTLKNTIIAGNVYHNPNAASVGTDDPCVVTYTDSHGTKLKSNVLVMHTIVPTPTKQSTITSLQIIPTNPTLTAGQQIVFKTIAKNSRGDTVQADVRWSVKNYNGKGSIHAGTGLFTAEVAGNIITVQAKASVQPDGTQPTATTNVVVVAGNPVKIVVTPTTETITIGQQQQYVATGYDKYNNPITLTDSVIWYVTGGCGTISTTGLFSALSKGVSTITARYGQLAGYAQVKVFQVIQGATVSSQPQQPFARIYVQNSVPNPVIIDTRTRGGGVPNLSVLQSNDPYMWWDLKSFDGEAFQAFGVYVVNAPASGALGTIATSDITKVLSDYGAPQYLGVVLPPNAA